MDTRNELGNRCSKHEAPFDMRATCNCSIAKTCPHCGKQETFTEWIVDDAPPPTPQPYTVPIVGCRACGEKWEDDDTFTVRAATRRAFVDPTVEELRDLATAMRRGRGSPPTASGEKD